MGNNKELRETNETFVKHAIKICLGIPFMEDSVRIRQKIGNLYRQIRNDSEIKLLLESKYYLDTEGIVPIIKAVLRERNLLER